MTIPAKLLDFIGMEPMSNSDAILEELADMDNATLYKAFADNRVTTIMERCQCEDCKAKFGACPCVDNDEAQCRVETEEWLDWPCEREHILEGIE